MELPFEGGVVGVIHKDVGLEIALYPSGQNFILCQELINGCLIQIPGKGEAQGLVFEIE